MKEIIAQCILSHVFFKSTLVGVAFLISFFCTSLMVSYVKNLIYSYKKSKPNHRALKLAGLHKDTNQSPKLLSSINFRNKSIKTSLMSHIIISLKNSRFGQKISQHGLSVIFTEYLLPFTISCFIFLLLQYHFYLLPKTILFVTILLSVFFAEQTILQKIESIENSRFLNHFPNTLDAFKRSLKSGFTIAKAIEIASQDSTFEPIKKLFKEIHEKIALGMSVQDSVKTVSQKIELEEFRFFAITLSSYSTAGGNIVDILSNLSTIIRKRNQLSLKVKALSSEARMTGYILLSLPFIIGGIIYCINPEHLKVLLTSHHGKTLLFIATVMFLTGAILMFKITNIKV